MGRKMQDQNNEKKTQANNTSTKKICINEAPSPNAYLIITPWKPQQIPLIAT